MGQALQMPELDGVEHRYADVNGARIHYAQAGEGDPLVLLHGWPQHWWSWREVIGPLAATRRVIAPDVRGLGWSGGSHGSYRFDALADDLVGLLDSLALDRVALVGHDWGAAIGYSACLNRPDRFDRFVPLTGVTPWASEGGSLRMWLAPWHIYLLAAAGRFATPRLRMPAHALHAWRHRGRFTAQEERIYLDRLLRPESVEATARFYRTVLLREVPYFVRHHRRMRLRVTTLHLNAEHDPIVQGVPDAYRRYADDMRLETIPDCGHFIPEERPEELLDRLTGFLGATAARTRRPSSRLSLPLN